MRWWAIPLVSFLILWSTGVYVQAIMKRQSRATFCAMAGFSLMMMSAALVLLLEVR